MRSRALLLMLVGELAFMFQPFALETIPIGVAPPQFNENPLHISPLHSLPISLTTGPEITNGSLFQARETFNNKNTFVNSNGTFLSPEHSEFPITPDKFDNVQNDQGLNTRRDAKPSERANALKLKITNALHYREIEYPDYDGWYNNLASPSYGTAGIFFALGSDLLRHTKAHYPEDDDVYQIPFYIQTPNPYEISRQVFQGPSGLPSVNNKTVFFVAFTSHLMNEIVNAREPHCPREMIRVQVPMNHTLNLPQTRNQGPKIGSKDFYTLYRRCAYNPKTGSAPNSPRILINKVTSFLDGSSIYGENKAWSQFLRSHSRGQLKYVSRFNGETALTEVPIHDQYPAFNLQGLPMKNLPPPSYSKLLSYKRLLIFGDDTANESPFSLTMGILWFRWHNYLANILGEKNPSWNDEIIFNEARKWVIATYQKITIEDWLPVMLGHQMTNVKYKGYKPELNPAISLEFEALASRYHYTMMPNGLYLGCNSKQAEPKAIRLCNSYWNPQNYLRNSLETYILGMSTQIAEKEDVIIVEDLRTFLYGTLENTRKDFVVENIVHSLDAGIPMYNDLRAAFSYPTLKSFKDLNWNTKVLEDLYENVNNMDAWTGIMLESKEGSPGPLLSAIIMNEFYRLRDSDRYWYEDYRKNGLITVEEYKIIKNITIRDIVLSVTDIPNDQLPRNLFVWTHGDPCQQRKQMTEGDWAEACAPPIRFNYFKGSKVAYIISFLFLGLFIIGVALTMLIFANKIERASLKTLERRTKGSCKFKESSVIAQDWVRGEKSNDVAISFDMQELSLSIHGELKEPYRRVIKFNELSKIELYRCIDKGKHNLILLKVAHEYDHILTFGDNVAITTFLEGLNELCMKCDVRYIECDAKYKDILAKGFTKKDRQKQLELFFKTAFTKAFADNSEFKNFNNNNSNTMLFANQSTDRFEIFNDGNITSILHKKFTYRRSNSKNNGDKNEYTQYLPSRQKDESIRNSDLSTTSVTSNQEDRGICIEKQDKMNPEINLPPSNLPRFLGAKLDDSRKKVGKFFRRTSEAQITPSDRPEVRDYCLRKVFNPEPMSFPDVTYDSDISLRKRTRLKSCELTRAEFAEALSLKETSIFVENMFALVDKDKNGRISFCEFLDFIVIFFKGSAEDKARVIFDMYDVERDGHLTKENFKGMLESLMELSSIKINSPELNQGLETLFNSADLNEKHFLSFHDFLVLLGDHKHEFEALHINWEGTKVGMPKQKKKKPDHKTNFDVRTRRTIIKGYRNANNGSQLILTNGNEVVNMGEDSKIKNSPISIVGKYGRTPFMERRINIRTYKMNQPKGRLAQTAFLFVRYLENYRWHVFWSVLYTLVVIGIFLEKAYSYSFEMEHTGLRRIIGFGGSLSRGAASALMFCYSTILLTMCRNIITFFRETFLRHFIPFDAALPMHKYIATLGVIFTFLHIMGHALNFYHLSTQAPDDQLCMMRSFYHFSHDTPKFQHMLYGTITGLTGIFLVIVLTIIYIFALPYARRHLFNLFWKTHNLYILFYVLTFLHGLGMMLQMSIFAYFFLGPMVLFTIDKLISLSRKKSEIPLVKADILPSNVTNLVFKKPPNFEYKSGQWVRIAITCQGTNEYHPFTLTSSPHEEHLSVHIRAVGPWTNNLRRTFDSNFPTLHRPPKILLDGPFGEGHQDWDRFQVSVLIGGGIGVTPFASILKDIVQKSTLNTKMKCQKVYFLWITRTQKQFEWLTDIIRDVEEKDYKGFVSVNIFITQLYQKFDLRTAMLYICERHFYKVNDRSLFTGLKAITHFGRPDFVSFFMSLQEEHPDIYKFGVFSCGPPGMTHNVESATQVMNKLDQGAFIHHFENF